MAASTANYTISRAKVYWTPDGGSERELGNCPSLVVTPKFEFLDHYSSMSGVRAKDASVPVEIGAEISITLDEWTIENLAMAVLGTVSAQEAGDPGYDVGAGTQKDKIAILTGTEVKGKIRVVGTNTIGVKVEGQFPLVSFKGGNAINFLSEEWNQLELSGEILQHPTLGFGDIYRI